MYFIARHLPTATSLQRYAPYAKRERSSTWLDVLHIWKSKTKAVVEWQHCPGRAEGNRATHKLTPIVTCVLHHFPDEQTQRHLRRVSHDPQLAVNAARDALSSSLRQQDQPAEQGRGRKVLISFHCTIDYDPQAGAHVRYKVENINYTYTLENWTVTDCACQGDSKTAAQQGAAQLLMEKGYCMIPLSR